jgi:hypothetical protein
MSEKKNNVSKHSKRRDYYNTYHTYGYHSYDDHNGNGHKFDFEDNDSLRRELVRLKTEIEKSKQENESTIKERDLMKKERDASKKECLSVIKERDDLLELYNNVMTERDIHLNDIEKLKTICYELLIKYADIKKYTHDTTLVQNLIDKIQVLEKELDEIKKLDSVQLKLELENITTKYEYTKKEIEKLVCKCFTEQQDIITEIVKEEIKQYYK